MHPTLLELGPFTFHSYTVLLAGSFLVATYLWFWQNARREVPFNATPMGALLLFIGVLLGSKIFYAIQFNSSPWWRVFLIWEGGLVFYGGLIGGTTAALAYIFWNRLPFLAVAESVVPYIPVFHGIGRIGCFLNGCCWGRPTEMPWGVVFPKGSMPWRQQLADGIILASAAHPAPVHPTQLYSTAGLFVIGALLFIVYRRPHPLGLVLVIYPFLYGILRFIVESFRADSARPVAHLTVSQIVSLLLIVGAITAFTILWAFVWRRGASSGVGDRGASETI
jgi:phosphatidylglycerol:prolipoprotein diacylglycerol transferase